MPVRKTESRTPFDLAPSELGEAVASSDEQALLVSMITAPLATGRPNTYVVFVTDSGLASQVEQFEWTFTENADAPTQQTTQQGEVTYTPASTGQLEVVVRLKDSADTDLKALTLVQPLGNLQAEIETLLAAASEGVQPTLGNPEAVRELVNDLSPYYQDARLLDGSADEDFERFLFTVVNDGVLRNDTADRHARIHHIADVLNTDSEDLPAALAPGVGVSALRLPLLAMHIGRTAGADPLIEFVELPEVSAPRVAGYRDLLEQIGSLDEDSRIDLFNVARFPKSNIKYCGVVLELLRDRYFSGTSFADVLAGMGGTRAHWITRHYSEGPLLRA